MILSFRSPTRRAPMRWSRIRGSPSSRGPVTHRRPSGRTRSTASSSTSSPATVLNRPWKRRLLPLGGVVPISPHRGELDEAGLRTVYQILERGGVVLIFPEGRYSRGRALRPLKVGIGHFALQAGVPISPVAVRGTDVLRPFSRIDVNIG